MPRTRRLRYKPYVGRSARVLRPRPAPPPVEVFDDSSDSSSSEASWSARTESTVDVHSGTGNLDRDQEAAAMEHEFHETLTDILSEQIVLRRVRVRFAELNLSCNYCAKLPYDPVTGPCGHTLCRNCFLDKVRCCGELPFEEFSTNILIKDLLNRFTQTEKLMINTANVAKKVNHLVGGRRRGRRGPDFYCDEDALTLASHDVYFRHQAEHVHMLKSIALATVSNRRTAADFLTISAQTRVPKLSTVAAKMLDVVKNLTFMPPNHYDNPVVTSVYRRLLYRVLDEWTYSKELECRICYERFYHPVTTPCGHTFCRECIEKCLDYNTGCPLCHNPLVNFNLSAVKNTEFLTCAMAYVGFPEIQPTQERRGMPIVVCTLAYPGIACPLIISEPHYKVMVRNVMRCRQRTFAVVPLIPVHGYADVATIVEIRDCVETREGMFIVSTIGLTRVKITRVNITDGLPYMQYRQLVDETLPSSAGLVRLLNNTYRMGHKFLAKLRPSTLADMRSTYGTMPEREPFEFLLYPEGPRWLWWLTAVLPLSTNMKQVITYNAQLPKRAQAIEHWLTKLESNDEYMLERA